MKLQQKLFFDKVWLVVTVQKTKSVMAIVPQDVENHDYLIHSS